ncbi:hypothetical protein BH10CYA1_BH10CYA1_19270 [soil metagenome]
MSFLLRPAHNIENYNTDLNRNHDHQVSHLADEVAHNLRFADFGFSAEKRLNFAHTELEYDAKHLSKDDFNREVSAIQNRLPNRDFEVERNRHGDVIGIQFNGVQIYEQHQHKSQRHER